MIRAALTQTIIILINILTRHELPLKDVVLNKFPHFFFNFSYPLDTEHLTHQHRFIHTYSSVGKQSNHLCEFNQIDVLNLCP